MATAGPEAKIDIGVVISRGFQPLARHFLPYLAFALLLVGLPSFFLRILLLAQIGSLEPFALFGSPVYWLTILVSVITGYLLQAVVIRSSILHLSGREPDFGTSGLVALRLLLPMIGLAILSSLLIGLGLLLLIVPGVIIYIMLIVSVPVLVEEERGVIESMARSRELTRGNRGRILLLLVLYLILSWAVAAVVGVVSGMSLATSEGANTTLLAALEALTATASAMLTSTMVASLYVELKTVKEGATTDSLAAIFE